MEKCEHQKVSKQSGKRAYASKYLGNCHPNYVGFNTGGYNLIAFSSLKICRNDY